MLWVNMDWDALRMLVMLLQHMLQKGHVSLCQLLPHTPQVLLGLSLIGAGV